MTELERRALLGDQEAQKECTEKGIVLPCPICGEKDTDYGLWTGTMSGFDYMKCENCGTEISAVHNGNAISALGKWNTRPAPPIGHCYECLNKVDTVGKTNIICAKIGEGRQNYDYCSYYEPREEK